MASMNPALKEFWRTKADVKVLKGGRASTKTWDTAAMAVYLASKYKTKFLCCRQFQSKIQESVYAIIVIQIERFGLDKEFDIQRSVIRHMSTGSEFHFYGIQRNIAEIKGFEGADICWIEEGEALTKEQWKIISPTIFRTQGAEIWLVYNPRLISDFVETYFKHDPANGTIVRQINYNENPFLSDTIRKQINKLKIDDYEEYEHIYLGIPLADDDRVIIKRSWIEAAIDAHIELGFEPIGKDRLGNDVADSGKDLNSLCHVKGNIALWGERWKGQEDELFDSCIRVYNHALRLNAHVTYDSIGVGAGCGSNFKKLNEQRLEDGLITTITYDGFNAGGKVEDPDLLYKDQVLNKDFFSNVKSQRWWLIADLFRNTYNAVRNGHDWDMDNVISISSDFPNLADLMTQLSTPRRHFDKNGRVKVESKEDLAKRQIDSPNDADSFIMAFIPPKIDSLNLLLTMMKGNR